MFIADVAELADARVVINEDGVNDLASKNKT
jgi:hypothetical protein